MEELGGKLVELVTQLQGIAPQVWEVAMRQVTVQLYLSLIWLFVGIVGTIGGIAWLRSIVKRGDESWDGPEDQVGWALIAAIILVLSLIVVGRAGPSVLQYTLNPQWSAIELLLGKIR